MGSEKMLTATAYGFYFAPVFSYYFSTGYFACKEKEYSVAKRKRSL